MMPIIKLRLWIYLVILELVSIFKIIDVSWFIKQIFILAVKSRKNLRIVAKNLLLLLLFFLVILFLAIVAFRYDNIFHLLILRNYQLFQTMLTFSFLLALLRNNSRSSFLDSLILFLMRFLLAHILIILPNFSLSLFFIIVYILYHILIHPSSWL